jgi:hypothetical protein
VNLHRLLKIKKYRPGGLVLASAEQMAEERASYLLGEKPNSACRTIICGRLSNG